MIVPTVKVLNTANPDEEIIVNESSVKEIVYTTQRVNFLPGKRYANPQFFQKPIATVEKVYVVGNWPKIVRAYAEIGIPVHKLDTAKEPKTVQPIVAIEPNAVPVLITPHDPSVEIPEDFRELSWQAVRSLASKVSPNAVVNKAQAIEAIEAELERRGK